MRRVDSLEKTLMLGGIGGRRRRGWQRMGWLDGITDLMDVSLCELREMVMNREAWCAVIHGLAKSRTRLSDWTELTRRTLVGKVISLLLNMLSRLVIIFLPRSKHLLILWLQSPSAVILEPQKWSLTLFLLFPHLLPMKWWDRMLWSKFFGCWILSQPFHSPLWLSSRGSLVLLHFLP